MKSIKILPLLFFGFVAAKAQVNIQANQVFTMGSRFQVSNDFLFFSEIDSGQAGANQIYDFTNLESGQFIDTLSIVSPDQAPFGNPFPESNRVVLRNKGRVDSWYLNWQNESLSALGNKGSDPGDPPYLILPEEKLVRFPMQFGDSASGQYVSPLKFYVGMPLQTPYVVDSVRRKTTVRYRWAIDGWGEVGTPLGIFPCLRQRIFKTMHDTADFLRRDLNVWVNGVDISSTQQVCFWYWTPIFPFPVVRLGDLGWNGFINDVEYVSANLQTTKTSKNIDAKKPLIFRGREKEGNLRLELPNHNPVQICIFNLQGRIVFDAKKVDPNAEIQAGLHSNEVYLIRVQQGRQVWVRRWVF